MNPRPENGQTAQGFYVVAPDGSAYGFNNNRSVDRVLDFLSKGLDAFEKAPPGDVTLEVFPNPRVQPPVGASVLRLYSRILPVPAGCHSSNENLQRDHLWVLADEVQAMERGEVANSLAMRLCRFALVDAVRGEPDFWSSGEVRTSSFAIEGRTFKGEFAMRTRDGSRGLEGSLEAEFAVHEGRVTSFKGYVEATAWGNGRWTPNAPAGQFPIKFAIVLAPDSPDTVSPQAAMMGRGYLAPSD